MPFTLAHPAAVVPVHRVWRRLSLSALVVGSLAPDFEYLIRLQLLSEVSHTLQGVLTFCLPLGLGALWLFHAILKRPLLLLLPPTVRQPLLPYAGPFPLWPLPRLTTIVLSILLGALSHLAWDAFTHLGGWGVQSLPWLQGSFSLLGFRIQAFKVAQHGSTLVGLSLLAWWTWRWLSQQPVAHVPADPPSVARVQRVGWAVFLIVPALMGIGVGLGRALAYTGWAALRIFVVGAAIGGMTGLFVAALLVSLIVMFTTSARAKV